jgi:hypothetical protein
MSAIDLVRGDTQKLPSDAADEGRREEAVVPAEENTCGNVGPCRERERLVHPDL